MEFVGWGVGVGGAAEDGGLRTGKGFGTGSKCVRYVLL